MSNVYQCTLGNKHLLLKGDRSKDLIKIRNITIDFLARSACIILVLTADIPKI